MCCSSGRHLNQVFKIYEKKIGYYGFDINKKAKIFKKKNFHNVFKNAKVSYCSMKSFCKRNKLNYSISFTHGRSIDLINPDFNMIKHICNFTEHFVILVNLSNEAKSSFSRFWDYEFNKYGFKLINTFYPESSFSKISKNQENRKLFSKIYVKKNSVCASRYLKSN